MHKFEIKVPERFDYDSILPFIEELKSYIDNPLVIINFENLKYSYPLPMLVIGSAIRRFVRSRRDITTQAAEAKQNRQVFSYLEHLGFFNFIGLPYGKKMGQAKGSSRYIPIKELNKALLSTKISLPYRPLRHVIFEEAKSLADVLVHEKGEESKRAIAYSIREIIRNVFEHSESENCYICGQRWYDGSVEIAIIDEGIGIRESLSNKYDCLSDLEAVRESLQPAVSGKNIFSEEENIHSNSGFGLYVLSELGKQYGWFCIGSGNARVKFGCDGDCYDNLLHKGTYVGLHINKEPVNFGKELEQIIYNGECEAYAMGRPVKASSSSSEYY